MPRFRHMGLPLLAVIALMLRADSLRAQNPFEIVGGMFKTLHSLSIQYNIGHVSSTNQDLTTESGKSFGLNGAALEGLLDLNSESKPVHLELGLGVSYLANFRLKPEGSPQIRGAIRELPSLTLYANFQHGEPGNQGQIAYVGIGTGLIELWNARGYTSKDRQFTLSSQTFEFAISAGHAFEIRDVLFPYLEISHRWRQFPSIDYKGLPNDSVGAIYPRELKLNDFVIAAGVQFSLRSEEAPPVEFAGSANVTVYRGNNPGTLYQNIMVVVKCRSATATLMLEKERLVVPIDNAMIVWTDPKMLDNKNIDRSTCKK